MLLQNTFFLVNSIIDSIKKARLNVKNISRRFDVNIPRENYLTFLYFRGYMGFLLIHHFVC